jgi:ataxia telangiectasia mutated family protein
MGANLLGDHVRRFLAFARDADHLSVNAVQYSYNASIPVSQQLGLRLEEAKLAWKAGQIDCALRGAKSVLQLSPSDAGRNASQLGSDDTMAHLRVDTLCLLAEWLSSSRSEATSVSEAHLNDALYEAKKMSAPSAARELHRVHYQFGRLMDRAAQTFLTQQQTFEYATAKNAREQRKREISSIEDALDMFNKEQPRRESIIRDHRMLLHGVKSEHSLDLDEHNKFQESLQNLLTTALQHYCKCLTGGDAYDNQILFRLISLWFTHHAQFDNVMDPHLLQQVPSRKFIPLVYQIASRLHGNAQGDDMKQGAEGARGKEFRRAVRGLIKRMAIGHPHHTLYQVFALSNNTKLNHTANNQQNFKPNEGLVQVATSLLDELRTSESCKKIIDSQIKLIEAYLALAEFNKPRGRTGGAQAELPTSIAASPLGKVSRRDLSRLPIPTATLLVRHDCAYSDIVHIHQWRQKIEEAASGVNRPFVLSLEGSDGHEYKHLLKSADDLRQDAVIEEVSSIIIIIIIIVVIIIHHHHQCHY